MPGKKRRKSSASTGKASAKRKPGTSTASVEPIHICSTILRHVLGIASSKSRSREVLQTFYDGKFWTETKQVPANATITITSSPDTSQSPKKVGSRPQAAGSFKKQEIANFDCYWIILATNTMNRLLVFQDDEGKTKPSIVKYVTALADALATILISDKSKLEKCAHQSASRSTLCRAILTSTLAAMYGIRNYNLQKGTQRDYCTYEAAVATLDRLVHLKTADDTCGDNIDGKDESHDDNDDMTTLSTVGNWTESSLAEECSQVEKLLASASGNSGHDCVKILLETSNKLGFFQSKVSEEKQAEVIETTNSTPEKRSTRARTGEGTTGSIPSQTKKKVPLKRTQASTEKKKNKPMLQSIDPLPIVAVFEKLLASEDFGTRIDGRVAIKRWASIAVVWSQQGEGQNHILREIHALSTLQKMESILTPFQKSRLMGTLISIVIETGNQCGVRPPTGGIQQYLMSTASSTKAIKMRTPAEAKLRKRQKKADTGDAKLPSARKTNKTMRRADIRDWTVVVIYDYLQNHKRCLLDRAKSPQGHEVTTHSFCVPNFSDLITGLCRVASSSVQNSSYTKQSSWKKTLLSIAVAFCFEITADPVVPLDGKMMNFALSQFVDSMRMMDTQSNLGISSSSRISIPDPASPASVKKIQDFEKKHSLRLRLPTPLVPTNYLMQSDTEFTSTDSCSFADIVSNNSSFTDEHAIALAIRAVQTTSHAQDLSPAPAKLLTFLISLVKRAYNGSTQGIIENFEYQLEKPAMSASSGKRKRAATKSNSNNRRCGRRRKIDSGEAHNMMDQEKSTWQRISPEKVAVAIPALNAIRMWLMNSKRTGTCTIRYILRSTVTMDHMLELTKLGETLEKIIIKSRCLENGIDDTTSSLVSNASSLSSSSSADDFTSSEILLWNAHMIMCQVFGRGQLTYIENNGMDPIIWDSTKRMAVFQAITAVIDLPSSEWKHKIKLSLPAAHHALLAANMSCALSEDCKDPERHLVTCYINLIIYCFGNLKNIALKDWGRSNSRIIEDEIPLSYNDARTFMLALDGVSLEEKCRYFDQLVNVAFDTLKSINKCKSKRKTKSLLQNSEVSGFIARFLVICYSLMNRVASGKELRKKFFSNMGCAQIHMPSFVTYANWYCRDRTFMGIFDAWESPSLPDGVISKTHSPLPVSQKSLNDFHSLLEMCFSMGFDAAPYDHCHLLFAAWNGLDQVSEIGGLSNNVENKFPALRSSVDDSSRKILQLREDIFSIYKDFNEGTPIDLKEMIFRASEIAELALENSIQIDEEMRQEIPLQIMVLLAALPTYIGAGISGYTNPGNDYFSTTISKLSATNKKRNRGYSSESDPPPSECGSDEDIDDYENEARIDALSRLKDCCDAFGAAPIHPDWLDVSCSLRDGIRPSDAVEVAEKAINTLISLITTAFTQYKRHQAWALQKLLENEDRIKERANLCSTLLRWSRHEIGPSQYTDDREWLDDVAALTQIPLEVIEYMLEDMPARDLEQTKACWCPYAGQRIPGFLQQGNKLIGGWETSDAELRAGGEWEILLAKALCVSCLNTNQKDDQINASEDDPVICPESRSIMAKAQLWRTVFMSAISNLVPTAALLRLALGKVGRKPHPFAFHENDQDPYDVVPLHFSERVRGGETLISSSLRSSVCETLSMLSRLSIEEEESLSVTCHAIASHLVVDTNTFSDLESLYATRCAFMGLRYIHEITNSSPSKDAKSAIPFVMERLVSLIADHGRGNVGTTNTGTNADSSNFQRLYHVLGNPSKYLVDTIVNQSSIDIFEILKSRQLNELCEVGADIYQWHHAMSKEKAVEALVSILCEETSNTNSRTRAHAAQILSHVGKIESKSIINLKTKHSLVVPSLIKSFNRVDKRHLKSVVTKDLCGIRGNKLQSKTFKEDIASIFCLLLFSQSSLKFEKAKFVHDALLAIFNSWNKINVSDRELSLNVLLAYGSYFNTLFEIGSTLVELREQAEPLHNSSGDVQLLSIYFAYIKNLQQFLTEKDKNSFKTKDNLQMSAKPSFESTILPSEFPRSCSFIQKSGFHGQHWYHCHTCNLVADKGCCTLCALVCHRDHDVAYSRYSSFFCDCAAEDGNAAEQNRVSCRCLSSLEIGELSSIYENECMWKNRSTRTVTDNQEIENDSCIFEKSISIQIAKYCFANTALKSVNTFLLDIEDSRWLDSLFRILGNSFASWKTQYTGSIQCVLENCCKVSLDTKPIFRLSHEALQRKLSERRSQILRLQKLDENGLVSVCVATGLLKKSSDGSSHDALTIARLSRNNTARSILVSDSRGRVVIAEPGSLLFFSPLAAVNARSVKKSEDEHFTRQQMCVLGTSPLSFNVIGMRLCPENERHLIIWGASEACILVLKTDYSGVEDTISLTFEVDDQDRDGDDALVNCEWLPGSQTHVAVGVSRYVRLFDVCRFEATGKSKRAHPVIGYNLGFEASLRDLSIVPQKEYSSSGEHTTEASANYRGENISKMFLLLENGRLHSLDIKICNGKIESPCELHFEPSECVSISTEGIRPRSTSSIGLPGATSRTLGEGSKLVYLKQSRCLLYKCKSAAVVALMLGTDGNVTGTFEFLPHTIPLSLVGSEDEDDVFSISGPFTLWTELGMVYREGETFFRVICAGTATRNNQPKLLCIDFNERKTKIKDITCSSTTELNIGSFEGLGTYTSPIMQKDLISQEGYNTGERVFVCALTSRGYLYIFGEDIVDMMPTSVDPNGVITQSNPLELVTVSKMSTPIKKFPLTIFEQLTNVSENEHLTISCHGIGIDSKELKNRLARDSSLSFECPRREGCCLTISLPRNHENSTRTKSNIESPYLVISAIRILVGSALDHMPSKLVIQGRSIDITPNLKRWYNVPLNMEEIARGMRAGLVSLCIGPSFDTTNAPIIDSIEVFARDRKSLEIPKSYFASMPCDLLEPVPMSTPSKLNTEAGATMTEYDGATSNTLVLGVCATTNMCELIGPTVRISDIGKALLRQLIQIAVPHPDKKLGESLQKLSDSLESDARARWSFHDENMLAGCSRALDECKTLLGKSTTDMMDESNLTEDRKWKAIRMVLQDCLKVSTMIARERPNNYLQSMGSMSENNSKSGSIAIEASTLILKGLKKSKGFEELIRGCSGIVSLSLTEMAIVVHMDDSASTKDFMQISQIREFLDVANVSTCKAISTFFQENESEQSKNSIPDLFVQMEAARRVAYQCDSCEICPINKVRYTILEKDYEIDLCKKCYELGKKFASKRKHNPSTEVVINGKSMGQNLTCFHMKKMEPVSLEKIEMDVEQVDVQYTHSQSSSLPSQRSGDSHEDHQKVSKLSLGENDGIQKDLSADHRGYEYFLGELFSFVMEQLMFSLKKKRCNSSIETLIKLGLDLIRHSKRDSLKHERAARFVKDLSKGILHILNSSSWKLKLTHHEMSTLVMCIRGLSSLMSLDSNSVHHFPVSKSQAIHRAQALTDQIKKPNHFVCDVHGIPAVRRRCDKAGVNKDRRFYVCGKEKGQRCSYFKWADDGQKKKVTKLPKTRFRKIVQAAMLGCVSSSEESIYDRLCTLLEGELFGELSGGYDVSILASNTKEKKNEDSRLESFYSVQNMEKDFCDGVFCSKEKLFDLVSGESLVKSELTGTHEPSMPVRAAGDRGALLLEASLDLLTLIADHKVEGISRWFSILCEINLATDKHSSLRSLATRVLKSLCGGNRKKFRSICDHFTFCFQLKKLYHFSCDILESAMVVREKTRLCSDDWKNEAIEWSNLGVGDFIGTQDLISEDDKTELNLKGCGKALDDMWVIIKNRGWSWRQFCGYRSLPLSLRQSNHSKSNKKQISTEKVLSETSPIKVLFLIASTLGGIHQVKVLRMIDFALIDWKERKSSLKITTNNEERSSHDKDLEDDLAIGVGYAISKPEEVLLKSDSRNLTVNDIIALSLHLVHSGKTIELRRVTYQIVSKLCQCISTEERLYIFQNLVTSIENVGMLGKAGVEFLNLLQYLSQFLKPNDTVDEIANFVVDCFMQQLDAIKYDRSNYEWALLENDDIASMAKKKFDLSGCHFCVKPQHYSGARESTGKSLERRHLPNSSRVTNRSGSAAASNRAGAIASRQKWHYEQASPFSRCRLETLKQSCVSNEFNLFYKLKHRVLISDINLSVSDPRGRYVKILNVYFTSTPLPDSLKSSHYASKWQKIATINLAKGGSRATVSLSQPIIAANIRVEFSEFYERPGEKDKGNGGTVLLHCPRCTRPVTNAHGVCVTCGEVAFQCRKCRHINYDRLDAFLCVECGYTCCGSFSLELNSAVVSNAIAITNDEIFNKYTKIYGTVSSIQEELKEKLAEKLRRFERKKRNDTMEVDLFSDSVIERSIFGLLPPNENENLKDFQADSALDQLDKQGSLIKYAAHPENHLKNNSRSNSTSDRSERARSLLRLARQIRSESSSSSERRRSTDIIIRHLGRVSLQNLEDENELLELLESGKSSTTQDQDDDKEPEEKEFNQKVEMEECQKMHILLREAWRESYDLQARIDAWRRLNTGALVQPYSLDKINHHYTSFSPSHCSLCGGAIAFHLLVLWQKLFLVAPTHVRLNGEFFGILFEGSHSKGLYEIKKQVIISIVTNSHCGAEMVLKELEKRLGASRDMYCADILGKIMEIQGFGMIDEYTKLALHILSSQADLAVRT